MPSPSFLEEGCEFLMVRRLPLATRDPDIQSVSSSPPSWAWRPVAFYETAFNSVLEYDVNTRNDLCAHTT